jgi:hypothetical protein
MDAAQTLVGSGSAAPSPPIRASGPAGDRAALATFVALLVVAFPLILFGLGRQRWFFQDEWDFLVTRHASSVHDLLRPHNEHWSTLPVLVYRGLWAVFGLHSYRPYQAVVVALHLTAVALLRVVMRRSGVNGWVATVTAAALILFGAGQENIVWAFQMGFVGALVFGLVQLLLADHEGRWDRRDWLGLAAGAAALMCSGIGVTMVVVVGVAALIRRGWRVAAAHTAPLAALYLAWFVAERPGVGSNPTHQGLPYVLGQIVRFVIDGVAGSFRSLGYFPVVGIALAAVLVGGLVVAGRREGRELAQRAAGPLGLLVGVVVLLAISGWGRWQFGPTYADQSRYLYLTVAMLLPALAVAVDALGRRWLVAVPLALALVAIGVPGNVAMFGNGRVVGPQFDAQRQTMLGLAASPLARQVPPGVKPDPFTSFDVTIGWLLKARQDGKLGDPGPIPQSVSSQFPVRLGLQLVLLPYVPKACTRTSGPVVMSPPKGKVLVLSGDRAKISAWSHGTWSPPVTYNVAAGHLFVVELAGLRLRLAPGRVGRDLLICR